MLFKEIRMKFHKLNKLTVMMMTSSLFASSVYAAGLDRSGQSVAPLFEKGNYAQVSYAWVDPNMSGMDVTNKKIKDVGNPYGKPSAAVKFGYGETDNAGFALIYEQAHGVDTEYPAGNLFSGTHAKVSTNNLTALVNYRTNNNFLLFGGVTYELSSGEVTISRPIGQQRATATVLAKAKVTGDAFKGLQAKVKGGKASQAEQKTLQALATQIGALAVQKTNYKNDINEDSAAGFVVGFGYTIPKIALRSTVTYRSATKHQTRINEVATALGNTVAQQSSRMIHKFPQSINIDFQTGVNPKTLLMAGLRWVDWEQFIVEVPVGGNLASYDESQYSGYIGLGRKITDKISASIQYSYDSGAKPYTLLGPYGNKHGISVGGKYQLNDMIDVAMGVNYTKLGDAKNITTSGNKVADFKDSYAVAVGGKLGVRF